MIINTYFILFLISLGLNLILFLVLILRKSKIEMRFEDALYILDSVISNERSVFFRGLYSLSKKYRVMTSDGKTTSPTDRIEEYKNKKKELKEKITKRVIRQLSKNLRSKLLEYYSEHGLASYIIIELEKENSPTIVGGTTG